MINDGSCQSEHEVTTLLSQKSYHLSMQNHQYTKVYVSEQYKKYDKM